VKRKGLFIAGVVFVLLLGAALTVSPVIGAMGADTGAEPMAIGVQNVEDKIDCVVSWLRNEKDMDISNTFKSDSHMLERVNSLSSLFHSSPNI